MSKLEPGVVTGNPKAPETRLPAYEIQILTTKLNELIDAFMALQKEHIELKQKLEDAQIEF